MKLDGSLEGAEKRDDPAFSFESSICRKVSRMKNRSIEDVDEDIIVKGLFITIVTSSPLIQHYKAQCYYHSIGWVGFRVPYQCHSNLICGVVSLSFSFTLNFDPPIHLFTN